MSVRCLCHRFSQLKENDMSASFRFKQFTISQEHAPMKVGTDGVLLGAWANGGMRILDVGTGTGLIALMMAQRFTDAQVVGIDINDDAITDATCNVADSPFADRIMIENCALQQFDDFGFDAIVCNPPFFVNSLKSPDFGRTEARHSGTLDLKELVANAFDILDDDGCLSVILPYGLEKTFVDYGTEVGLKLSRIMRVRPTENTVFKRVMIELRKSAKQGVIHEKEMLIEKTRHVYSDDYILLTKDFYLDK